MVRTITTLDISKYKKDFNRYFTIGDHFGGTHKIGNTELSDEIFLRIFEKINTIVLILPDENGVLDKDLIHKVREESGDYTSEIKNLLRDENLTFHSIELHKSEKADCKSAVHFFVFDNYFELDNFLRWEELGQKGTIKAYTTLTSETNSDFPNDKNENTSDHPEKLDFVKTDQPNLPRIYKLSIGPGALEHELYEDLLNENLVTVHTSTKSLGWSNETQYYQFSKAKSGDYFYLCRGNRGIVLVGMFADNKVFYTKKEGLEGWGLRRYKLILNSANDRPYSGIQKWWTPNHNSTFSEIAESDYDRANNLIFLPFFKTTIQDIFRNPDMSSVSPDRDFYAHTFAISNEVEGVIGVDHQAAEIVGLLKSLKDDEPGKMVGIFGRWGRGKSFLWKHVKSLLEKDKVNRFEFVEFHAWKYQDTPASWAYLYEEITKVCVESSEKIKLFGFIPIPLRRNVWVYNRTKRGTWPIVLFTLIFAATVAWSVFIPADYKLNVLITLGIGGCIFLYKLYFSLLPKAKDLFRKYSKVSSFKSLLGFQKEIQDELKLVLEATLRESQKRILLFVDDLDRCSEDRIIAVIDSLKVMLEDEEIAKKVLVLTAVDERILKRAIEVKYYNSISKSLIDQEDSRKIMVNLVREYLDKLFIAGIKLTELNSNERTEILDAFTIRKSKVKFEKLNTDGVDNEESNSNEESETILESTPSKRTKTESRLEEESYEVLHYEYSNLVEILQSFDNATPRTIRIFYYRYLLAKRLLRYRIQDFPQIEMFLANTETNKQLMLLILQYSLKKEVECISKDSAILHQGDSPKVKQMIFETSYEFDRDILIELLKVIEMVVAY